MRVRHEASEAVEKVLAALADDDERKRNRPDEGAGGGGGPGKRGDRRREKVDRRGRVVERALRQTVHRTPSTLAEDVVSAALRGVERRLMTRDDDGRPRSR